MENAAAPTTATVVIKPLDTINKIIEIGYKFGYSVYKKSAFFYISNFAYNLNNNPYFEKWEFFLRY